MPLPPCLDLAHAPDFRVLAVLKLRFFRSCKDEALRIRQYSQGLRRSRGGKISSKPYVVLSQPAFAERTGNKAFMRDTVQTLKRGCTVFCCAIVQREQGAISFRFSYSAFQFLQYCILRNNCAGIPSSSLPRALLPARFRRGL